MIYRLSADCTNQLCYCSKQLVNRRDVKPATCFFLLVSIQFPIATTTLGASFCAFRLRMCSSSLDTRFIWHGSRTCLHKSMHRLMFLRRCCSHPAGIDVRFVAPLSAQRMEFYQLLLFPISTLHNNYNRNYTKSQMKPNIRIELIIEVYETSVLPLN